MEDREQLIQEVADVLSARRNRHRARRHEEDRCTWALLRYLHRAETEVNPTELCQVLGVTTPRITNILNDMEDKGLICRQISSQDRRRINVTLTDKGLEKMENGRTRKHELISKMIDAVGEDDIHAFLRVIKAEEELEKELEEK